MFSSRTFMEKKCQLELQYSQVSESHLNYNTIFHVINIFISNLNKALSKLCNQFMNKKEYQINNDDSISKMFVSDKILM
jgi:hypothetical protein